MIMSNSIEQYTMIMGNNIEQCIMIMSNSIEQYMIMRHSDYRTVCNDTHMNMVSSNYMDVCIMMRGNSE